MLNPSRPRRLRPTIPIRLGIVLLAGALHALFASAAGAACAPAGSNKSDDINCTATQTTSVVAGAGNDRVTVQTGASIGLESITAAALTAIDAGSGNDSVDNNGRVSVTLTATPPSGCGNSSAIGIAGGSGNDTIGNAGAVTVQGTLKTAGSPACPAPANASRSAPTITSVGIQGEDGRDQIENTGSVSVNAASDNSGTQTIAKGIAGGNSDDAIVNTGSINVAASSTQKNSQILAGDGATVTAVGIDGASGKDQLGNDGVITVNASSSVKTITPTLTLSGGDAAASTTTVDTRAAGFDTGTGKDAVTNTGSLSANATSDANGVSVNLNLIDLSHGDASTLLRSTAVGIDASQGKDGVSISNSGTIGAGASSTSSGVAVEVNAVDAATGDAALTVQSTAIGIAGARGMNSIDNSGAINASASSRVLDVGVNVSYVDATIADRQGSNTSTTVDATATGIDLSPGRGEINILQGGSVQAAASATAHSVAAGLGMEGVPQSTETLINTQSLASIGITSNASATGVTGGTTADQIYNDGVIGANAGAGAIQDSIGLGITVVEIVIPTPNISLVGAGTAANASATGIAAGLGDDVVVNNSTGSVSATTDAGANAKSFSLNLGVFALNIPDAPEGIPLKAGVIVADSATTAAAKSTGIDAGAGDDDIRNHGSVQAQASANAGSLAVSANATVEFEKGEKLFALDAVVARATTEASSQAVGIDGGAGSNRIYSDGSVNAGANANAVAVATAVSVAGTLKGAGGILNLAATDTSSSASADATGIRGGDDAGMIGNMGSIAANASANVTSVSASVSAAIAKEGLVVDVGLARAQSNATATATGIDANGSGDQVVSSGTINSNATANADSVAVTVSVAGTKKGVAGGAAVTDAATTATATAIGIKAGATQAQDHEQHGSYYDSYDNGPIHSQGAIGVEAQARTLSVSASANLSLAKEGVALGAALADTSTHALATAKGIEGNTIGNDIDNEAEGTIGLKAGASGQAVSVALTVEGTAKGLAVGAALTDASVTASANAIGADGAEGRDSLDNRGSINISSVQSSATAVGVSAAVVLAKEGAAIGAALANTSATANATATGLDGGSGNDGLMNEGNLTASNVSAHSDAVTVSLDVALSKEGFAAGAALAKSDSTARATATGLDGGSGNDVLSNSASIALQGVHADALGVSVSLAVAGAKDGAALSAALVDADASAIADATGITGGAGDDRIDNSGSIAVSDIKASGLAVGVGLSASFSKNGAVAAAALAETGTTATATAKGLDGGAGYDEINNDGGITLQNVKADAGAVSVSVGLSGALAGVTVAAGLADASGKATTVATGIDGGADDDSLTNKGNIKAEDIAAAAHAASISVALSGSSIGLSAAAALANTGAKATTTVKGLDGGDGDDSLSNAGNIGLHLTKADADSVSVSLSVTGSISAGVAAGAALTKADATATATAIGLDGGAGNDWIENRGPIAVDGVTANALAVGASVQLGISNAGVTIGAALADTHASARAAAKGMDGGSGNDELRNENQIALQNVNADARAVSVGLTLNGTISGGVSAGVALTDGRAVADASAVGMDGGAGRDTLYNNGAIRIQNVEADAHAAGISVTLNASFAGVAAGAALADTSATATTLVKGMDGGAGDDKVSNMGSIDVQGKSKADALSIAINISGTLGVAAGAEITHSNTTANATVVGIDAGAGRDQIENSGNVAATAEAESKAASIGIGISLGIGGDATLTDAKSSANATAIAIDNLDSGTSSMPGGYGYSSNSNVISNDGNLSATATATSTGTRVSGNLFGYALGDLTNKATAIAVGIRAGDDADEISNYGSIQANSSATATGLSVSVNLGGKAMGDAGTTAQATATGIQTGGNDDMVSNDASISANARSHASATTVSVGLIGVAEANASTNSLATANGIDGGDGKDKLVNRGSITAGAVATASADGTNVNIFGVARGDVSTTPTANANGIAGGAGDDDISQLGSVNVAATAGTSVSNATWQIGGSAGSKAGASANAGATGLDGGNGNDSITNHGASFVVRADASASADSSSWTLAGVASDSGTLTANARATGIAGGSGNDYVGNETGVGVTANASLNASGGSAAIFGNAGSNTQVGATASAFGIDAGSGNNSVDNSAAISVASSAVVNSNKTAFSFAGNPDVGGLLAARSIAVGISAGNDDDNIHNSGQINVSAASNATGTNGASADLGGSTSASGSANVSAAAVGIEAANGRNRVDNDGSIVVGASASPVANNDSSAGLFFSEGGVSAIASSNATATGIDVGNGDNSVNNRGSLTVAISTSGAVNTHAAGGDVSLFGAFGGNATATGISTTFGDVAGIRAGNGNQKIYNGGTIDVRLTLGASAFTDPNSGDLGGTGSGTSIANAGVVTFNFRDAVKASGIVVGDGASQVVNSGSIRVTAKPESSAGTDADGTVGGDANGFVFTDAAVRAAGILAGNGNQLLVNDKTGTITVIAQAKATSNVDTDPGSTDGDSSTLGRAQTNPTAIGIGSGNGNSRVANDGLLDISSTATSISSVRARGGRGGEPTADARAFAFANAIGVEIGNGNNVITNTGTMTIVATANSTANSSTDRLSCAACGGDNTSLGDAVTQAVAAGVRTGDGNNQIQNDGKIDVRAVALSALNWDGDGDDNHRVSSASASAVGIDAGKGNNVIVNRGTITVTAVGIATNNGNLAGIGSKAIGIRTGEGNDLVVNSGTITATEVVVLPVHGTAISTGGGDDVVKLTNGSVTNGNIDLGSGTNRLVLEGTPVINGSILDASSTLSLVFNSSGSFGGSLPGASAVKNGPGTFTLSMLNKMERIEVNQGTLKLDSDYSFPHDGVFQARFSGDGSSGQFYVNGRAGLDGSMKIVRGSGAYRDGASFEVLKAANGIQHGTSFSQVELPDDSMLVKFHSQQSLDAVRVSAEVSSFTLVAGNANQMAIARNLDRILPAVSGDFGQALGNVQAMSGPQFANAFASLSPAVYGNYSAGTVSSMQQYSNLLQDRLVALRQSDSTAVAGADAREPMRLAYNGGTLSGLIDARETERALSSGVWVRGFSQKGEQDSSGVDGFDYRLTGSAIGYDTRVSSAFSVGASLASARNKVKADRDMSDGDVDSTLLSLYAGYFDQHAYVTGALSAGRNRYDIQRDGIMTMVSSKHDGRSLSATLGAGFNAHYGSWSVNPFLNLQYTRIKEESFSETGVGAMNVSGQTSDNLVSTLGARVSTAIDASGGGRWIPQTSLAWLHDYSGDRVITASYVDAPDASFSVNGQPVNRNGTLLGLGLAYRSKGGVVSSLNYNAEFRDGFRSNGFIGELRFEF